VLQGLGIQPNRSLEDDSVLQTNVMSYGGNGVVTSVPPPAKTAPGHRPCACNGTAGKAACQCPAPSAGKGPTTSPSANGSAPADFARMTAAEKIAYHKARWDRILG
jgi:hypothetical protein